MDAIDDLRYGDKDYFETKSSFIRELGYIDDSSSSPDRVRYLQKLYDKTADTSSFQNPVLHALASMKTTESYNLLKKLLTQDPPVFDNSYEYGKLFKHFSDSLTLSKTLFPEILQLASFEDYRPFVNRLLKNMADSGYLQGNDYQSYFTKLYFDAKIELKKQQNKDEKQLEMNDDDDVFRNNSIESRHGYRNSSAGSSPSTTLEEYAVLLMPFYEKNANVPKFYEKLLQSKDVAVQLIAAKALITNNKKVPDSLFASVASQDRYRARLYDMLVGMNREELFPAKYKKQEMMAKALLLNDKKYTDFADIQLVNKRVIQVKGTKGHLYLFKYKIKSTDDWKMGISGLQPFAGNEISCDDTFVKLTNKKLQINEPENDQFDEQVQRLLFAQHKSGRRFYDRSNGWRFSDDNFED